MGTTHNLSFFTILFFFCVEAITEKSKEKGTRKEDEDDVSDSYTWKKSQTYKSRNLPSFLNKLLYNFTFFYFLFFYFLVFLTFFLTFFLRVKVNYIAQSNQFTTKLQNTARLIKILAYACA